MKEHQAGFGEKELFRKPGVSDATFYKWLAKYGGMDVSDVKKQKALEAENARLKKLLAEQMMDVSTLKEMLGKTSEAWCATTKSSGGLWSELLHVFVVVSTSSPPVLNSHRAHKGDITLMVPLRKI